MEDNKPITIDVLVTYYQVDRGFFSSLEEYGLLRIVDVENTPCIAPDSLAEVERMIRLHYELDINMPGIDAISHLLRRLEEKEQEINRLRNRLGGG